MVAITYECPNCHWHQGHAEGCPSWYEQPSTEQPASATGSEEYVTRCVCGILSRTGLCEHRSHEQQPPAPAAQETGEWRVDGKGYAEYGARVPVRIRNSQDHVVAEVFQIETAEQIVRDHNEHQSLSAERERLRAALQEIQSYRDTCMICVSDEEDTALDTEYRKGARAVLDNVAAMASRALNEQGKESG